MRVLWLFMLILISCASGDNGAPGSPGADGSVVHEEIVLSTVGGCYEVVEGLHWVENEGHHMDVYNNADCDHDPLPNTALCNNIHESEHCVVSGYLYFIEGTYGDMILHVLEL